VSYIYIYIQTILSPMPYTLFVTISPRWMPSYNTIQVHCYIYLSINWSSMTISPGWKPSCNDPQAVVTSIWVHPISFMAHILARKLTLVEIILFVCIYIYMTLLFILVTLAHFHFVLVVDTVPYSGALSNCRDCDVIEWTLFLFQV
jgi:hypothetical protein